MKKTTFLSLILFCCLSHSNVVNSTTWKTADIVIDFKTKYFCNKNLSQQDCDKIYNSIKQYGIDINLLRNTDIKSIKLDKITYQTTNTFAATDKITSKVFGLLMLPDIDSPKGVILYYHPMYLIMLVYHQTLVRIIKQALFLMLLMLQYMLQMAVLLLHQIMLVKVMTTKIIIHMFYTLNRQ